MKSTAIALLVVLALVCTATAAPELATYFRAMTDILKRTEVEDFAFDLTATVTYVSTNRANENTNIAITDETGASLCRAESRCWPDQTMPVPGARAHLQGCYQKSARGMNFAVLTNYEELARGPCPKPVEIRLSDLADGKHYFQLCRRTGILRDVLFNEADPDWLLFSICSDDGAVLANVPIFDKSAYRTLNDRIGCLVSAPGYFVPYDHGPHGQFGCKFKIAAFDQITLGDRSGEDTELAVDFDACNITRASDVITLGRRSVTGWVVAVWRKNASVPEEETGDGALLRTKDGDHIILAWARDEPLPHYGEFIRATGLPVSDLYRTSLLNANWIKLEGSNLGDGNDIHTEDNLLAHDPTGHLRIDYTSQGRIVAISGLVQQIDRAAGTCRLAIKNLEEEVSINASAKPEILDAVHDNCVISVRGTCLPEVKSPLINEQFYRLGGIRIIPRSRADITILSTPAWWMTFPWRSGFGILLVLFLTIAGWNLALRRLAEKRGRELASETLAHAVSDLKVYERTRLAVELHDSLAQTLTGVAFELDAAGLVKDDIHQLRQHLGVATRALKACRAELRNSLWDLRHDTLEDNNMETAIRKTLEPHTSRVKLTIRFPVPRERISDNSAHAILRIIRELTVNAIRHGHATTVRVAGAIEDSVLRFSVTDNGCGFDPTNCPGDCEGHFGILGIRERINSFEGRLDINSEPGKGTKVTISLRMPQEQQKTA